jgi:hypothetical protein
MLQYKRGLIINQAPITHVRGIQQRTVLYSVAGYTFPTTTSSAKKMANGATRPRRFQRGLMLISPIRS